MGFWQAADDMDFASLLDLDMEESASLATPIDLEQGDDSTPLPGLFPTQETVASSFANPTAPITSTEVKREIKIAVPLERLNQSSQQVVETLLTARSAFNESSILQSQLAQTDDPNGRKFAVYF